MEKLVRTYWFCAL